MQIGPMSDNGDSQIFGLPIKLNSIYVLPWNKTRWSFESMEAVSCKELVNKKGLQLGLMQVCSWLKLEEWQKDWCIFTMNAWSGSSTAT
jgi:hypothetical protein